MKRRTLPGSDLEVSEVCLGTMTWGDQNSEADAHAQLDLAVARGVNFIDTAEMYPVPPQAATQGRTEAYLGSWLAKRGRDGLVIASKVAGPGRRDWIRGGRTDLTRENIAEAVDLSLRRLGIERAGTCEGLVPLLLEHRPGGAEACRVGRPHERPLR